VFVGVLLFSVTQRESACHVEEGCVSEEGSSPVYARMDARFKVDGRGTSDADDGLMAVLTCKKLGQLSCIETQIA
jgi:hypothetical protein